jgi:hypothetical protein
MCLQNSATPIADTHCLVSKSQQSDAVQNGNDNLPAHSIYSLKLKTSMKKLFMGLINCRAANLEHLIQLWLT